MYGLFLRISFAASQRSEEQIRFWRSLQWEGRWLLSSGCRVTQTISLWRERKKRLIITTADPGIVLVTTLPAAFTAHWCVGGKITWAAVGLSIHGCQSGLSKLLAMDPSAHLNFVIVDKANLRIFVSII